MTAERDAVVAKAGVLETVRRFTAAFDARDAEAMKAHFLPDGVWHRLAGAVCGHAGIEALMESLPLGFLSRHILSNQLVTLGAEGDAECISYITVFHVRSAEALKLPQPIETSLHLMGDCRDRLLWTANGWKIAERQVTPIFGH